ncbi:hypothetical protein HHK36_032367 [Tetracentron sinense]|uniref:Disease resistance R13L4/SHOC-2-like LRR domain-containing protein n=1 Tax=Tetracentron sinense TaxID=13715 RepID=A0A834Y5M2_TETSI|nr:hypothetical protein HHK36_032367 [Tetracentron sinense]
MACINSLPYLRILDLIGNRISGTIPAEIGELKHLSVLNVADNLIFGNIPPSNVNLSRLMHLDLNNNRNTGQIPSSISYQELENAFRDKELLGFQGENGFSISLLSAGVFCSLKRTK